MNCKEGDLAITRHTPGRTAPKNNGNCDRIVEVVKFVGTYRFSTGPVYSDVWLCDIGPSPMVDIYGRWWAGQVYIRDINLRPIRGGGGGKEWEESLPRVRELTEVK